MNIEVTHGHRIAWQNRNWGAKNVLLHRPPGIASSLRLPLPFSFLPAQEQYTLETPKYCLAQFPFMSTVYRHTNLFVPEFLCDWIALNCLLADFSLNATPDPVSFRPLVGEWSAYSLVGPVTQTPGGPYQHIWCIFKNHIFHSFSGGSFVYKFPDTVKLCHKTLHSCWSLEVSPSSTLSGFKHSRRADACVR